MQDNEIKKGLINAICDQCLHQWSPFGSIPQAVPLYSKLKCPQCGNVDDYEWLDHETQRKLILMREENRLKASSQVSEQKIDQLVKTVQEMTKRMELLEQAVAIQKASSEMTAKQMTLIDEKIEIASSKTSEIKKWAESREQEFKILDKLAEEIEEDETFREQHK